MIALSIAQNEIRRMFLSPLAWTVLALVQFLLAVFLFMLLSQYLELSGMSRARGLTETVIVGMLQIAGNLVLLITPFMTMRLFSEEQRSGSIKLLLSAPVSLTQIVIGKYLGVFGFLLLMLAMIALMPLALRLGTPLDMGLLAAALTGLCLLMMALSAIGLFISSLTQQPAVAAIGTFGVSFVMWIIHIAANTGNEKLAMVFSYLSLLKHYENLLTGLFSTADVFYFILLSVTFIALSIWRLDAIRTQH